MRPDAEQSFYTITDLQDQPEAKYALFLTIGGVPSTFQVDGVRWWCEGDPYAGVGLEAYRTVTEENAEGTVGAQWEEAVVRFDPDLPWSLVARTHLELVTKTQQREHYIAGLGVQLRADVRCARLMKDARAQAQQPESGTEAFDDYMRRQMGEDGGEKL